MFAHNAKYENALSFSRFDSDHFLSPQSMHDFELEDKRWASAEHYYQCAKYGSAPYAATVEAATSAQQAYRLGNVWWRCRRADFKAVRKTLMTRALYSKTIQNTEVEQALLATGEQWIIENSAYEHYWGIGRDQRGDNHLGVIWMDIRRKLLNAQKANNKVEI
ncbi:NADAR family protein [Marinagarivorans algicola]|uniref:NADAR family protein n=1 Tax=Marinagarivorans algicola TaxID=1513270 RepID=UPI0006B3FE36|nr:NADAR family protein [Marinagarivorans algicola]